jgi:hypothetical protein
MAHFAELGENNLVLRVIVVDNKDTQDTYGVEQEEIGAEFCRRLLGGTWKQTSYNSKFRKNYAGYGFIYDSERDAFIPPKLYPSWELDEETCNWKSPVPYPTDDKIYVWDETSRNWIEPTL